MIKNIANFLIFFIFHQISQIVQNGFIPFCDETLHILSFLLQNFNWYESVLLVGILYKGNISKINHEHFLIFIIKFPNYVLCSGRLRTKNKYKENEFLNFLEKFCLKHSYRLWICNADCQNKNFIVSKYT